jgi:hypothetical protein
VEYDDKALVLYKAMATTQEPAVTVNHECDGMIDLSEVAIFDEDDHGYPNWTHSLFNNNDDNCYTDDGVVMTIMMTMVFLKH